MTDHLPSAILIDLDDTIVMYSGVGDEVWESLCGDYARDHEAVDAEALYQAVSGSRRWFWADQQRHEWGRWHPFEARRKIVARALEGLGLPYDPDAETLADTFTDLREKAVRPFPRAVETLRELRQCRVKLGLVTNGMGDTQRGKIERFGLAELFDAILIEGEFGVGKPDARVYLELLGQLDASPSEAWCVGDNLEWEVAAPQRLGIYSIWHDHRAEGLPDSSIIQPDRIINRISELI